MAVAQQSLSSLLQLQLQPLTRLQLQPLTRLQLHCVQPMPPAPLRLLLLFLPLQQLK